MLRLSFRFPIALSRQWVFTSSYRRSTPATTNPLVSRSGSIWRKRTQISLTRSSITGIITADPSSRSNTDSPVGAFLAPVVAARGGNARLPLHLLEFLFARFLVLTSELLDPGHPGYRFGAMAISPARLERVFVSLAQAGLDLAPSTADGVVTAIMSLHASLSFAHEQWTLLPEDLVPLQCGYHEVDKAPLLFPVDLAPVGASPPHGAGSPGSS